MAAKSAATGAQILFFAIQRSHNVKLYANSTSAHALKT
jgi:hypothetical protein